MGFVGRLLRGANVNFHAIEVTTFFRRRLTFLAASPGSTPCASSSPGATASNTSLAFERNFQVYFPAVRESDDLELFGQIQRLVHGHGAKQTNFVQFVLDYD